MLQDPAEPVCEPKQSGSFRYLQEILQAEDGGKTLPVTFCCLSYYLRTIMPENVTCHIQQGPQTQITGGGALAWRSSGQADWMDFRRGEVSVDFFNPGGRGRDSKIRRPLGGGQRG